MEVLAPSQSVLEKLQIKDEKNVLIQGLPSTIEKQFAKLTFAKNITPLLRSRQIDFALVFAVNKKQLDEILKEVLPALAPEAKLWVAYPKVASKIVSDITRDCNWECLAEKGFESVRLISVDNVWSAMRFKKADQIKESLIASINIDEINLETRVITAPADLQKLFNQNKEAQSFFDSLSFSNKKEYVVWITSAKKEETKQARLQATINKLNDRKKNPSDK